MTDITIKPDDLNQIIKTEIQKVLFLVSDQYKINQKEILEKILPQWKCNLMTTYSDILDNKKFRPINPENFCFARKPNLDRCTRNKKKGSEYCASHQHIWNRVYGRIDEEPSQDILNLKKKKNQKCQVMIKVQPKTIADKQYFIDDQQHLYVSEKVNSKIHYRWIGDWDEPSQSIQLKKTNNEQETKKSRFKPELSKKSVNRESINRESINRESINRESINKESVNNESVNKESVNNESVNNELVNELVNNELVNESVNNELVNESVNNESVNNELVNNELVKKVIKPKSSTKSSTKGSTKSSTKGSTKSSTKAKSRK